MPKEEQPIVMDLPPMTAHKIHSGPLGVANCLIGWFSSVDGRRPAPNKHKTRHVRLITIGASHYCEKARWALDMLEADDDSDLYYTEDAHPPAFNAFCTVPVSGGAASQTPMIVIDSDKGDSKVLYGSNVILHELCPSLYPASIRDDIMQLEDDWDRRLGAPLRCYAYHAVLTDQQYYPVLAETASIGASKIEKFLFSAMLGKGIDQGMKRIMNITDETAAASKQQLLQVFEQVSKRLEKNGGQYLMDTAPDQSFGFTAADLTFCALAFPFVRPPCMSLFLVQPETRLPPSVVELSQQLRQTTAGQYVLRIYQQHRPVDESGKVVLQSSDSRNAFAWKALGYYVLTSVVVVAGAVGATRALSRR